MFLCQWLLCPGFPFTALTTPVSLLPFSAFWEQLFAASTFLLLPVRILKYLIHSFGFIFHSQTNSSQIYIFQSLPARLLHSHIPFENVPQSQHIQNWNYFVLPKFKLWIILRNFSYSLYLQVQFVTMSYYYHPIILLQIIPFFLQIKLTVLVFITYFVDSCNDCLSFLGRSDSRRPKSKWSEKTQI